MSISTQNKYFNDIIGQEQAKTQLSFFLESFKREKTLPNLIFLAPAGAGKTLFARELGLATEKNIVTINCGELKNTEQLFEHAFLPLLNKDAFFFFDEVQNLNSKVTSALLTILNTNSNGYNTFQYQGYDIVFDFKKHSFACAGTEKHKIFKPLLDRFHEIQLVEYSKEELAQIIKYHANKITKVNFNDIIGLELASFARTSARSAFKLGQNVGRYCQLKKSKEFSQEDLKDFIKIFDIFELGLTRLEIEILNKISEQPIIGLTALCAKTGMTKQSQQEFEGFLLKNGLMEIEGKRKITMKGREYLRRNYGN